MTHFFLKPGSPEAAPAPINAAEIAQFLSNSAIPVEKATGLQLLQRAGHQLELNDHNHSVVVAQMQEGITMRDETISIADRDQVELQEEMANLALELGFDRTDDDYSSVAVIQEIRRLRGVDAGVQGTLETAQNDYNELSDMLARIFSAFGMGEDKTRGEATSQTLQLARAFAMRNENMSRIKVSLGLAPTDADNEVLEAIEVLYQSEPLTAQLNGTQWINECVDLAHAVRGNFAPENRVLAKAAERILSTAPEVADGSAN